MPTARIAVMTMTLPRSPFRLPLILLRDISDQLLIRFPLHPATAVVRQGHSRLGWCNGLCLNRLRIRRGGAISALLDARGWRSLRSHRLDWSSGWRGVRYRRLRDWSGINDVARLSVRSTGPGYAAFAGLTVYAKQRRTSLQILYVRQRRQIVPVNWFHHLRGDDEHQLALVLLERG